MSQKQRTPIRFDRILWYGLAILVFGLSGLALFPLGTYYPYEGIISAVYNAASNLGAAIAIIVILPAIHVIYRRHKIIDRIENMLENIELDSDQHRTSRPAYLLADSIDRIILEILKNTGGDFEVVPEIMSAEGIYIDDSPSGGYENKLAKLVILGFLATPKKWYSSRVFLTARALDALNAPASLFVTNIPDDVWQHVFRMKISIREEGWDAAAVHMAGALELMLMKRINEVREGNNEKWAEMIKKNPRLENPLGLGKQLAALRSMRDIENNSFEDLLIGELVEMRNRIHPREGVDITAFGAEDARKMDLYLDILLQSWYGFR